MLTADRACIHCGYNLRGLSQVGQCPECGKSIADSLRGNYLEHADPHWLDKLRLGCALKLWNIVFGILVGGLGTILVVFGFPQFTLDGLSLIGVALGIWASFAITTQEPRIALHDDSMTLRKVIRFCVVAAAVGSTLPLFLSNSQIGLATLFGALQLAGIVSFFGELTYLRRFALRVPDPGLSKSTKIVQWGGAITIALGIVIAMILAFVSGGSWTVTATTGTGKTAVTSTNLGGGFGVMAASYVCILGLAAVVFGFWYLRLLTRYRQVFSAAALASRNAIT